MDPMAGLLPLAMCKNNVTNTGYTVVAIRWVLVGITPKSCLFFNANPTQFSLDRVLRIPPIHTTNYDLVEESPLPI